MARSTVTPASAAALTRYERRLLTMTRALLLTDRRETLGSVAARACRMARADIGAVYIHDSDGDDAVVAPARRWPSSRLAEVGPTSPLSAWLLANRPSEPALLDIAHAQLGPAMASSVVSENRVHAVLLVARAYGAQPFTASDLPVLLACSAEAELAIVLAEARRQSERAVLANDRNRIARELHDGVIQSLYGIGLVIEGIRADALRPSVKDQLSGLTESINLLIDDLRAYIDDLTPASLTKRGLGPELCALAKDFQASCGVIATVRIGRGVDEIGADLGRDLVQIAREALSNTAKHAAASKVALSLRCSGQNVKLEIADDGSGLAPRDRRGRGLLNILRRVQAWGGTAEIGPLHGRGTAIRVSIPARAGAVARLERTGASAGQSETLAIAG